MHLDQGQTGFCLLPGVSTQCCILWTVREDEVGFLHDWTSSRFLSAHLCTRPQRYREVMGAEAVVTQEGHVLVEKYCRFL